MYPDPAVSVIYERKHYLQTPRKDLARMKIHEVRVDVAAKQVIWIKARPDFDVILKLLNNLSVDVQ